MFQEGVLYDVLTNNNENAALIYDKLPLFKGITPLGSKNKETNEWDYSNFEQMEKDFKRRTNLTIAQASVFLGIAGLFERAVKPEDIEVGNLNSYTIQEGDTLNALALKLGTTENTIHKYTRDLVPEKLIPGKTKIVYKRTERIIAGWESWEDAIKQFNGGDSVKDYVQRVMQVRSLLEASILRDDFIAWSKDNGYNGLSINISHVNPSDLSRTRTDSSHTVLHTTEAHYPTAQRRANAIADMKKHRKCNYFISRDGTIFPIMPHFERANHAGLSRWNGLERFNYHSWGIEVEGYHDDGSRPAEEKITDAAYHSLEALAKYIQATGVPDANIHTHGKIAYAANKFTLQQKARGRKKCARGIDFNRLDITPDTYDSDAAKLAVLPRNTRFFKGRDYNNGRIVLPNGGKYTVRNGQRRLVK